MGLRDFCWLIQVSVNVLNTIFSGIKNYYILQFFELTQNPHNASIFSRITLSKRRKCTGKRVYATMHVFTAAERVLAQIRSVCRGGFNNTSMQPRRMHSECNECWGHTWQEWLLLWAFCIHFSSRCPEMGWEKGEQKRNE